MELDELTRENEALNEQVKLLVKTERRLYGAQRVIELQLRRLQTLANLATNAGRAGDPDVILELALGALVEVLDVDQAVALVTASPSGARLAAQATQPGWEPPGGPWHGDAMELPTVARPLLLMPRPPTIDRRLAALLDALNDYFAPRRAPAIELVVPLRRKSGRALGVIVLRKLDLTVSFHESRISEADLPFVELVASRVETDVENILLYRELEQVAAGLEQKVEERTEQLLEASKRAAMLTLVAGLSHELNNPVAVILGYAQGLLATADEPLAKRQLAAIERQARRCSILVKALLGFAENRPVALDSIPPSILLRRVIADSERDASARGVGLFLETLAEGLPPLVVSEETVREALGQLVKNALHATAAGGTVQLHARERRRGSTWGIELSVRDSGAGIPRAFLSRIFDPFFTTKPPGQGVGLGLSLARRSIESHGGRIDVRSELGRGTTVRVWLPVPDDERNAIGEAHASTEQAR